MLAKVLIVLSVATTVFGLKCYQCDGWKGQNACNSEITGDDFAKECDTTDYDACETVSIRYGSVFMVTRRCAIVAGGPPASYESYNTTVIHCKTDKCNGNAPIQNNITTPANKTYSCYRCNSALVPQCSDTETSIPEGYKVNCASELPGIFDTCSKIVVKVANKYYTSRDCGISFGNRGCFQIGNTGGKVCNCVGDYCNGSSGVRFSILLLIVVVITTIFSN